jgi:hypothetical protein
MISLIDYYINCFINIALTINFFCLNNPVQSPELNFPPIVSTILPILSMFCSIAARPPAVTSPSTEFLEISWKFLFSFKESKERRDNEMIVADTTQEVPTKTVRFFRLIYLYQHRQKVDWHL